MASTRVVEQSRSLLELLPEFIIRRLTQGLSSWMLALFSGALVPLAFAPFNTYHPSFSYILFFPLALFLFQLLFVDTAKEAFLKGWLFGMGLFGMGVSWLYVAIHDFGAAHWSLAGFFTGIFVLFVALYYAFFSLLVFKIKQFFSQNQNTLILFYIPVLWVLFEWLRSWLLTGFPWLLFGYPMIETPLSGYAPIVGIYGLSWIVVFISTLFIARIRWLYGFTMIALLFVLGGLIGQVQWSQPQGDALSVSLIQGNVNQSVKWDREQLEKTKQLYVSLSKEQWHNSDVIVWPENAIPVFYHNLESGFYHQLATQARETQTELITGLPVFDDDTRQYYNAMTNIGGASGFYYKTHLVPFGEYVPLASLIRGLIKFFNMPMSSFSAGDKEQPLMSVKGNKAVVTICYEDVFAEDVIRQIPQSQFMINLSNNGWYGDSFAPHQHLEMARMRALESSRELIRSTTSGISALIGVNGEVLVKGPQFETAIVNGSIQPRTGTTPFVFWGNYPVLLLLLTGIGLLFRKIYFL